MWFRVIIARLSQALQKLQEKADLAYLSRRHAPPSLLVFTEPDEEAFLALRGILERMPIGAPSKKEDKHLPACTGTVDTVLSYLRDALSADVLEMRRFTSEEMAVYFDYRVQEDWRDPSGIRVLTQMRPRGRRGSVSYGPLVKRVALDQYRLWKG
jgi:hypothetical protein